MTNKASFVNKSFIIIIIIGLRPAELVRPMTGEKGWGPLALRAKRATTTFELPSYARRFEQL